MRDQLAQLEADIATFSDSEPDEADDRTYDNVQATSLWGGAAEAGRLRRLSFAIANKLPE
jgi:hypothetical protein